MMRAVRFNVSEKLLRVKLGMPDNSKIFSALWHPEGNGSVELFVENPELPELKEGEQVAPVTPAATLDGAWNWTVPKEKP